MVTNDEPVVVRAVPPHLHDRDVVVVVERLRELGDVFLEYCHCALLWSTTFVVAGARLKRRGQGIRRSGQRDKERSGTGVALTWSAVR